MVVYEMQKSSSEAIESRPGNEVVWSSPSQFNTQQKMRFS